MVIFSASPVLPPFAQLLSETLSLPPLRLTVIDLTFDALHEPVTPATEIVLPYCRKLIASAASLLVIVNVAGFALERGGNGHHFPRFQGLVLQASRAFFAQLVHGKTPGAYLRSRRRVLGPLDQPPCDEEKSTRKSDNSWRRRRSAIGQSCRPRPADSIPVRATHGAELSVPTKP